MASAKRCKQFSENNIRSHEIAPRFKRQKSFTKQSSMESNNQNNPTFHRSKKAWGESHPPDALNQQKVSLFPREGRKIVKKLATQKAQTHAERNALKPQTQGQLVLSPMENKLFDLMRNDECDFPNYFNTVDHSHFSEQQYNANDNRHIQISPVPFGLSETAPLNVDTSMYQSNQMQSSPSQRSFLQSPNARNTDSPHSNYSDPDIRTIEMLRELERVADQTDVGSEESNNDKNSLVSHHLRMLMCAVDRYTAGVDDEAASDSCEEESLPASEEPQRIPSPTQQSFNSSPNSIPHQHPIHEGYAGNTLPAFSLPFNQHMMPKPQMLSTWNPWSTATFNGLDVYAVGRVPSVPDTSYYSPSDSSMFFADHNSYHTQDSSFRL